MDATRFDRIAKLFAQRRLSRRAALRQGGAGLAAGALAAAGLGRPAAARAQEATPAAAGDKIAYLFLQAFRAGTLAPKAGAAGTFTLTLEQGMGQTVFFSDRPARLVGAVPTEEFLEGFGFAADNPPNAALLLEPTPGATDIAVVELFNPSYDAATDTATYEAKGLADYEATLEMGFQAAPTGLAALAPSFGAAHLVIDDCPDATIVCTRQSDDEYIDDFSPVGTCWNDGCCLPCGGSTRDDWSNACNDNYPDCHDDCAAQDTGGFACW